MRLDNLLVKKNIFDSRTKAKQAIERGEIFINNKQVLKASLDFNEDDSLLIKRICEEECVSIGGFKLSKALKDFSFNVDSLICADFGASTGGFTDCLLKNGANKVYAIDLNDNLLHPCLKQNNKVVPIIKNVKELKKQDFFEKLDLVVADLSFISLSQVFSVISNVIDVNSFVLALIKPQFETGEKKRFKNGVIKDKKIHIETLKKVYACAKEYDLSPQKLTVAPLNKDKNVEFLMLFRKNAPITLLEKQLTY